MTEILTESFCERCGTRYTFESAAPGQRRLAGLKVLGRGLKQFVLSDDATLDEAIAAARSDVERDATNHQLDAFHRTFSFCMSCRQYTCANCWNESEARCLSCAPLAIPEPEPVIDLEIGADRLLRFVGQNEVAPAEPTAGGEHLHRNDASSLIGAEGEDGAVSQTLDTTVVPADLASVHADPGLVPAGANVDGPPDSGVLATDLDHLATGQTPGQSLDDAIAEYEARLGTRPAKAAAASPATVPDAAVAHGSAQDEVHDLNMATADAAPAAITPVESATADEPIEQATADAAPAAITPVEPATADEPIEQGAEAAPPTRPGPATPAVDSVSQPVWPVAPTAPTAPPQWPTGPRWPTSLPARSTPKQEPAPVDTLAALMAHTATDAMWAASSREILQPVAAAPAVAAVQTCSNCGISLSATARFCRRCGTPQG